MTLEEAKKRMNFEMETGIYTQYVNSNFLFKISSNTEIRLFLNFLHKLGYHLYIKDNNIDKKFNSLIINTMIKEYNFENITDGSKYIPDPFPEYLYDVEEIQGIL